MNPPLMQAGGTTMPSTTAQATPAWGRTISRMPNPVARPRSGFDRPHVMPTMQSQVQGQMPSFAMQRDPAITSPYVPGAHPNGLGRPAQVPGQPLVQQQPMNYRPQPLPQQPQQQQGGEGYPGPKPGYRPDLNWQQRRMQQMPQGMRQMYNGRPMTSSGPAQPARPQPITQRGRPAASRVNLQRNQFGPPRG